MCCEIKNHTTTAQIKDHKFSKFTETQQKTFIMLSGFWLLKGVCVCVCGGENLKSNVLKDMYFSFNFGWDFIQLSFVGLELGDGGGEGITS